MQRDEWVLEVEPANLLKTVEKKIKFHAKQIETWNKKQKILIKSAKKQGFDVKVTPSKEVPVFDNHIFINNNLRESAYSSSKSGAVGSFATFTSPMVSGLVNMAVVTPKATVKTKSIDKIQNDLSDCYNKMRRHLGIVTEYNGWISFVKNLKAPIKLDKEDYLYFYAINE